jgi:hypothetical protein
MSQVVSIIIISIITTYIVLFNLEILRLDGHECGENKLSIHNYDIRRRSLNSCKMPHRQEERPMTMD